MEIELMKVSLFSFVMHMFHNHLSRSSEVERFVHLFDGSMFNTILDTI